jgi:hypothetical protein
LFFELANRIVMGLNYIDKKNWPDHRTTQFLFISNNLIPLHNVTYNLLRGHWGDSMTLMRPILEAMVRMIWISCNPTRSSAGVIKQGDGMKEFNYTNFIKDDLGLNWEDYKMMSFKAHGNTIAVAQDHIKLSKSEYKYPIMPKFKEDKVMFEMCLNYVKFLEVFYLQFIVDILVTEYSEESLSKKLVDDAREYLRLAKANMRIHPKNYWPKVADDIEDLMELVRICDMGSGDYKQAWSKIRDKQ